MRCRHQLPADDDEPMGIGEALSRSRRQELALTATSSARQQTQNTKSNVTLEPGIDIGP